MYKYEKLIRGDLLKMAPYSSARTEASGEPAVALDANESPWPSFGNWAEACGGNRYPEPQPAALKARLARLWGCAPESLLLTRGSDEGIDLLVRLFCAAGQDNILICPPTYGMYEVAAATQGAGVRSVPLTAEGQLDLAGISKACDASLKLAFIPAPNAPLGHAMDRAALQALAKQMEGSGILVVDEAYVAFSDAPQGMLADVLSVPNLVVLRTFSKSEALAGERVGIVIADPDLIRFLRVIEAPYPLPKSSIKIALDALSPAGIFETERRISVLKAERERMRAELAKAEGVLRVAPSVANFLFLETTDAAAFMGRLERVGIRIRSRDSIVKNCVRISIGSPEENDLVLKALGVTSGAEQKPLRGGAVSRATKETKIDVVVDLDQLKDVRISTGIGFFDHMLSQIAVHGGFGLVLTATGDLETGQHHTIEDCALALGEALRKALGDRKGIGRYGFSAPLDEALAELVVDLSGRPSLVIEGSFPVGIIGGMESDMAAHFFRSFATALGASIHLKVKGENLHHAVEASFKALGRALRPALAVCGQDVPSTKGTL